MPPLHVAVVNDYEVIVKGVCAMLEPFRDRIAVVELDVEREPQQRVDVALFDTYGQPGLGIRRIEALHDSPHVGAVAVYTWTLSDTTRLAASQAGAGGVIAKALPADALAEAIEGVAAGRFVDTGGFRGRSDGAWPGAQWGLSARESETLALLSTGLANRSIAEALFVSENTVRTHLKAVFRKLRVTSRSQAVARALSDPSFTVERRA